MGEKKKITERNHFLRGYFPECIFPLVQPQVVSQGLHKVCSKSSPHAEANRATFTTFLQGTPWWSDSCTHSTNHTQILLPLTQAQLHCLQGLWDLYLCSWEEKSSLSCSLNWKNTWSSALTSLWQSTTTPRARPSLELWDSSGLDLSFSVTFHPTHLLPQGRMNINLEFDQLILSVPSSVFSHCSHCGQFELFRTENERYDFPSPSCDMCMNLPGWAPGGTGNFWEFLGISRDFYAMGTHLCTAEEDPESQDWGVIRDTYRGTHTHRNPAHALQCTGFESFLF